MPDTDDCSTQDVLLHAQDFLSNPRRRDSAAGKLILRLCDALAREANKSLTDCGSQHLAAERVLRLLENYGFPNSEENFTESLHYLAQLAGQAFNAAAMSSGRPPLDDDVPF